MQLKCQLTAIFWFQLKKLSFAADVSVPAVTLIEKEAMKNYPMEILYQALTLQTNIMREMKV